MLPTFKPFKNMTQLFLALQHSSTAGWLRRLHNPSCTAVLGSLERRCIKMASQLGHTRAPKQGEINKAS